MYRMGIATIALAIVAVAMIYKPFLVSCLLGIGVLLLSSFLFSSWIIHRQSAFPEVKEMLQRHKVLRTKKYDLYDADPSTTKATKKKKALMFLPGGLVEHSAYAGIAIRLSKDYGILVVVLNCEPMRLAQPLPLFGVNASTILKLSKQVEQHVGYEPEWNLGGHSLVRNRHITLHTWTWLLCQSARYFRSRNLLSSFFLLLYDVPLLDSPIHSLMFIPSDIVCD